MHYVSRFTEKQNAGGLGGPVPNAGFWPRTLANCPYSAIPGVYYDSDANKIVLPGGTYRIRGTQVFNGVGGWQAGLRLYWGLDENNIREQYFGLSRWADQECCVKNQESEIVWDMVHVYDDSYLEFGVWTQQAAPNVDALGSPCSGPFGEQYANLVIERVA